MALHVKKSTGWTTVNSFYVKKSTGWTSVTKAFVKKAIGWVQFWPTAGPFTTTAPYLSSDAAGNNRIVEPIIYGTAFYGQRGVWDANNGTISSYTYRLDSATSATISQGTITNIIPETSMGSTSIEMTPNSSQYDGKWMLFTVKAIRTDGVFGTDSTDNTETGTGYRIPVIRNNPLKQTGTTATIIGIATSLPATLNYSSSWNGTAPYLPDSTRSSVQWYTATSGAYTADNIANNGTLVTSGITTSTPTITSNVYDVTSSLVTPSTIPAGTYYYAVDTQKNSGTDYNLGTGFGIKQFAVFGPIQTPPNPPTNLERTLGNGSAKTFSWTAPVGGGTLSSYEYRYTSLSGDSGWINNGLSTSISLTVLYGTSNTFFVRSVGPTSNSSSVSTGSFTVPRITTAPFMLTRTSTAAEIDWSSNDQSSWSLSLSPAGATSPYTGTTESVTTTPPTDLVGNTTYTPTLTITSSTGDTHTLAGTAFTTLASVPGAPTNLQRTLGNGPNKTFTWDAPSSGTTPTSYEYNLSGAGWVSTGLTRSVAFTTIAGQNLIFLVRAVSAAGPGTSATTGQFTVPTAPTFSTTLIGSTSAKWEWTSLYQNTWSISLSPSGATSPYTGTSETVVTSPPTDLTANTSYTPTLRIYSISGDFIDKPTTAFTTLQAVPGAPTSLQRTLAGTSKTFSWSAPTSGGSVTSYQYQLNSSGFINNGASTSVSLTCPTGSNVFYVRAVGPGGTGTFTSTSFTIPTINSGPTASSITSSGARISWTQTNQSSWSLSGVGNHTGTSEIFKDVSLSASSSYTPTLTIASSTSDTATTTGASFSTPAQSFTVTFNANGGTGTMANQTANTATNLSAFGFTAPSGKGFSGWATSSSGSVIYTNQQSYPFTSSATLYAIYYTLPTAPSQPSPSTSNITQTSATISWAAPADGGSAITKYEGQLNSTGYVDLGNVLTTPLSGLTAGTSYTYYVRAVNAIGTSTSGSVAFTTTAAPVVPAVTQIVQTSSATSPFATFVITCSNALSVRVNVDRAATGTTTPTTGWTAGTATNFALASNSVTITSTATNAPGGGATIWYRIRVIPYTGASATGTPGTQVATFWKRHNSNSSSVTAPPFGTVD